MAIAASAVAVYSRFNPLDRGNLYQISEAYEQVASEIEDVFQSPRSGKFVSDPMGSIS